MERLQKIIAHAGLCSRRQAEKLIEQGVVQCNGAVVRIGDSADPLKDVIRVHGKPLPKPKPYYVALNKPVGYESSLHTQAHKSVVHLLRDLPRLMHVGRLDVKSQGLLLLTNDGGLAHRIMHPRYELEKVYDVMLQRPIPGSVLRRMEKGMDLDGERTRPCRIRFLGNSATMIQLALLEGKKRQIRRMFASVGNHVEKLVRVRIGPIMLGKLHLGKYRLLSQKEIMALRKSTGLDQRSTPKQSKR